MDQLHNGARTSIFSAVRILPAVKSCHELRFAFNVLYNIMLLPIGSSGIKRIHILNNKRHVLTKDSCGDVSLWDILKVCF